MVKNANENATKGESKGNKNNKSKNIMKKSESLKYESAEKKLNGSRLNGKINGHIKQKKLTLEETEIKFSKDRRARFEKMKVYMLEKIKREKLDLSFYVFHIKNVKERIELWRKIMPRIEIFYAAKVNPDIEIIKECAKNGTGYDVASANEIRIVRDLGIAPENCIFANPIKSHEQIHLSKDMGVKKMTFDTIEELEKIKKCYPTAECVIRLITNGSDAQYNVNEKFGAAMEDIPEILKRAK